MGCQVAGGASSDGSADYHNIGQFELENLVEKLVESLGLGFYHLMGFCNSPLVAFVDPVPWVLSSEDVAF